MIEVTDKAKKELIEFFKDKEASPVRVYLAPGGCSGPRLSLALDQPKESDATVELGDGITFCMDASLLEQAKSVKVDVTYTGFVVDSEVPFGGGGCGSGCGSGSAGSCGSSGSCCGS